MRVNYDTNNLFLEVGGISFNTKILTPTVGESLGTAIRYFSTPGLRKENTLKEFFRVAKLLKLAQKCNAQLVNLSWHPGIIGLLFEFESLEDMKLYLHNVMKIH